MTRLNQIPLNQIPSHVGIFLNKLNKHAPQAYAYMVSDKGTVNKDLLLSYYERISDTGQLEVLNEEGLSKTFIFRVRKH